MYFISKTDRQVEEIYNKAYKEKDYSTIGKAERALTDRGYKKGFMGWDKKETYEGEWLPIHIERLTWPRFIFILFLSLIMVNKSLILIIALLFPAVLFPLVKNKIIRDLFYILPLLLYKKVGLWALVLLPIRFLPESIKKYFDLHVFSAIYTSIIIITNINHVNKVVSERVKGVSPFFSYNWFDIIQNNDSFFWALIVYFLIFLPLQFITSRRTVNKYKC